MSIFLFKKFIKILFFSSLSIAPCKRPTLFLNIFFKFSYLFTEDWWSTFFDSSIKGHTQKTWFFWLICFLTNFITSSVLVSNLLYVLISFLFLGLFFIIDVSISPKTVIIIVLGIGVADITSTSQFLPPLSESFFLCLTPNLCCSSIIIKPRLLYFIFSWKRECVPIRKLIWLLFRSLRISFLSLYSFLLVKILIFISLSNNLFARL